MILLRRSISVFALAAIDLCVPSRDCSAQAPASTPTLIRQIDHVLISSTQAKDLFSLLADTFQLPVAWPMSRYGGFASGGVWVGNVNVEIIQSSAAPHAPSAQFVGLALEPEPLHATVIELDARRIPHGKPAPFKSKRLFGAGTTLWTTLALPSISSDSMEVFLCEYGHDVPARRHALREQLQSRQGGPLTLLSVREVVCGTTDLATSETQWQRLLSPLQPSSPSVWQPSGGPALRLVAAGTDGIQQLIITVTSLEQARRFLQERGLMGTDEPTALTLESPLLAGLSITLVQESAEPSSPDGSKR